MISIPGSKSVIMNDFDAEYKPFDQNILPADTRERIGERLVNKVDLWRPDGLLIKSAYDMAMLDSTANIHSTDSKKAP